MTQIWKRLAASTSSCRHKLALALCLTALATVTIPGTAQALDVPPRPTASPIVDNAAVLSAEQEQSLAQKIAAEQKSTGNQIGILTIRSLQGDSLEDYSLRVARGWGIGQESRDSGVLLLVAVDDRRVRIEVGYGLEGALPDIRASRIINDRITPEFRKGQYYAGINSGVDGIITAIHGEKDPNLKPGGATDGRRPAIPFEAIFFAIFFVPMWLASILARTRSWWAGGVLGGLVGLGIGLIFGFLFIGIASIIGLALIGLLFDRAVSRNFRQRRDMGMAPAWWAGGTHLGGGGRDSGGFGGFGGGSFGGGGSSGSW